MRECYTAAIVANKKCIPSVILVLECVWCAPPGPDRVRIKGGGSIGLKPQESSPVAPRGG